MLRWWEIRLGLKLEIVLLRVNQNAALRSQPKQTTQTPNKNSNPSIPIPFLLFFGITPNTQHIVNATNYTHPPPHQAAWSLSINSTSEAPSPVRPPRGSNVTVADTLFWIPGPAYRCFFGMLPIVYGIAPW